MGRPLGPSAWSWYFALSLKYPWKAAFSKVCLHTLLVNGSLKYCSVKGHFSVAVARETTTSSSDSSSSCAAIWRRPVPSDFLGLPSSLNHVRA